MRIQTLKKKMTIPHPILIHGLMLMLRARNSNLKMATKVKKLSQILLLSKKLYGEKNQRKNQLKNQLKRKPKQQQKNQNQM